MRFLWFMPVTFVSGQEGFLFFAPYLGAFLTLALCLRTHRRRVATAVAASPQTTSPPARSS